MHDAFVMMATVSAFFADRTTPASPRPTSSPRGRPELSSFNNVEGDAHSNAAHVVEIAHSHRGAGPHAATVSAASNCPLLQVPDHAPSPGASAPPRQLAHELAATQRSSGAPPDTAQTAVDVRIELAPINRATSTVGAAANDLASSRSEAAAAPPIANLNGSPPIRPLSARELVRRNVGLPFQNSQPSNHGSPGSQATSLWRSLATLPSGYLDDVAAWPRWRVSMLVAEATLFAALSMLCQLFALRPNTSIGIAFIPIVLCRAVALISDLLIILLRVGWAAPLGRIGGHIPNGVLFPRVLRQIDGIGAALSVILGAFLLGLSSRVPPEYVSRFQTSAFPLWVGTIVQVSAMLLVTALYAGDCAALDTAPVPHRATLASLPRQHRSKLRVLTDVFASRWLFVGINISTAMLAVKLDQPHALSWQAVLAPMYLLASCVVLAGVALGLACVLRFPDATTEWPDSKVSFGRLLSLQCVVMGGGAIVCLALAHPQLLSADEQLQAWGPWAPTSQWTPLGPGVTAAQAFDQLLSSSSRTTILLPAITYTACMVLLVWNSMGTALTKWRLDFAAANGGMTPGAEVAAHAAAAAMGMPLATYLQRAQATPRPPPAALVRLGHHRYRRVTEEDDVEALARAPPPSPWRLRTPGTVRVAAACQAGTSAHASLQLAVQKGHHARRSSSAPHDTPGKPAAQQLMKLGRRASLPPAAGARPGAGPTVAVGLPLLGRRESSGVASAGAASSLHGFDWSGQAASLSPLHRQTSTAAGTGCVHSSALTRGDSLPPPPSPAVRPAAAACIHGRCHGTCRRGACSTLPWHSPRPRRHAQRGQHSRASTSVLPAFDVFASAAAAARHRPTPLSPANTDTACACTLCFANEADGVLLECGHGGFCIACILRLRTAAAPGVPRCPLCRAWVDSFVRIAPPHTHTSALVPVLPF